MNATSFWAVIIGTPVLLGFALGFIQAKWPRLIGLAVASALPPLLVFAYGLSIGCALRVGGEECFGYGFGLVLALSYLPIWIILVVAGLWLRRRFKLSR